MPQRWCSRRGIRYRLSFFVLDRFLLEGSAVLLEQPGGPATWVRGHQETVRHASRAGPLQLVAGALAG
jgi:hypothetical protein